MNRGKLSDKLKEGVSVEAIESFTRKHMSEVFTVAALVIGAISSSWDFFTGPKLTIFLLALGAILGIFFPVPVERGLKSFYTLAYKQETVTQLVFGVGKIIVAIFIPFILFGFFGLLAGTAYHYYMRHAQVIAKNQPPQGRRGASGDEHD